jgi:hypothetical protein
MIGMIILFFLSGFLKGCDETDKDRNPIHPDGSMGTAQGQSLQLNLTQGSTLLPKATSIIITAVGVDDNGVEIGPVIEPVEIPNPTFPILAPITLLTPPCRYRFTITINLIREDSRTASVIEEVCQTSSVTFPPIDTFEEPIFSAIIDAPDCNAGEDCPVSCRITQLSAPDIDRFPLTITLREIGGSSVSEQINQNTLRNGEFFLSGSFPDPFPANSPQDTRTFTCEVSDTSGRTVPQISQQPVERILPTPTPTPTVTAAPEPTVTPPPGANDLQVTLNWNTGTDQDLHVIEPNGTDVFFGGPAGKSTMLDTDNIDGFGSNCIDRPDTPPCNTPENIFVEFGAAETDGPYQVFVDEFFNRGIPQTQLRVEIRVFGELRGIFNCTIGTPNEPVRIADITFPIGIVTDRGCQVDTRLKVVTAGHERFKQKK